MSRQNASSLLLSGVERLLDATVIAGIFIISVLVFLQFFSRYIMNFSLVWSEEIATFVMIWSGLLGLVGQLRTGEMISFNMFQNIDIRSLRQGTILLSRVATAAFFLILLWLGLKMSFFSEGTGLSSASRTPLRWVYAIYPIISVAVLLRLAVQWGSATHPEVDRS